jgi:hypothetical protein
MIFVDALSTAELISCRMILQDDYVGKLERIRKEAILVHSKVLSKHLSAVTK